MRLNKALEEKLNDVRLRDKLVADGKLTHAQVQEYLQSLPDDTSNILVEEESTETSSES